jgi:hypothetical protein
VPLIRTGTREYSSWPGACSNSRPNTFEQTFYSSQRFFLQSGGGPYILFLVKLTSIRTRFDKPSLALTLPPRWFEFASLCDLLLAAQP